MSLQIGANSRAIDIAERLLKENIDIRFVASVTGLSIEEVLKIKSKL